ncbi:polyketide synthase PksF [Colletotrichum higginsianum]|nr:polyketide synthase PksF [Colletotrichum higginsianum]
MPWLEGHQVQNQVVLPAAVYVSTAIEAARSLARVRGIKTEALQPIELSDFHIHNAVTFDDQTDTGGVEIQIDISHVSAVTNNQITANFTYSAALGGDSTDLALADTSELRMVVVLGNDAASTSLTLLPERQPKPPHVISVEPSRLYGFMESLEYDFAGPFRSLVKFERKLGKAACVAKKARTSTPDADALLIHPVDLDAAFQSVMLAYSYPGDDQLRLLHLHTSIAKVRVSPVVLTPREYVEPGKGFSGCVNMYMDSPDLPHAAVQVDQVSFKTVDRNVFYKMHWVPSKPDGAVDAADVPVASDDHGLMFVLSRIAAFYLRQFDATVPEDDTARSKSPLFHHLNYARHMTDLLRRGEHR